MINLLICNEIERNDCSVEKSRSRKDSHRRENASIRVNNSFDGVSRARPSEPVERKSNQ